MLDQVNEILRLAWTRIDVVLDGVLPGLLALVIVWTVTFLVAGIVRVVLGRLLKLVRFDSGVRRWGASWIADWSPVERPTVFVSRFVFWALVFVGLLLGVGTLDPELTSRFVTRLVGYLPNIVLAIFVVAAGTLVARFLARGALISAVNMQIQSAQLISLGVKWLILVFTAAMALDQLGVGGQIVRLAFGILFGGIVLALALAVGLGSKELVSRSLERQTSRIDERTDDQFHHL
jgi:hypothetical protein